MDDLMINIKELVYPCTTRVRAREAANKLNKLLANNSVILDLNTESISLSFLDELIFWISRVAGMRRVTFMTNDALVHKKLIRVADIRKNEFIKYKRSNGKITRILPKVVEPIQAKFVADKASIK